MLYNILFLQIIILIKQNTSMKKLQLFLGLFLLLPFCSYAAKVDSLEIQSKSLNRKVKTIVIVPNSALGNNAVKCPVIYLLHGHGANEKAWLSIKPNLPEIADEKGIIFVCPNGENSWYWDSPTEPEYKYESFIASDLVKYIDSNYSTIANRKGRAISGLSMGGHGAMWVSINNKDVFGSAGSMSGGLDIRPFPKNWNMRDHLGDYETHKDNWEKYTVINQLDGLKNGELAITVDCGLGDFFIGVNKAFHEALVERKIDHDFTVRPGGHTGEYWGNSVDYHILFHMKFFNKK